MPDDKSARESTFTYVCMNMHWGRRQTRKVNNSEVLRSLNSREDNFQTTAAIITPRRTLKKRPATSMIYSLSENRLTTFTIPAENI